MDGKEKNYTTLVGYILDLPNVGRTKEEIFDYTKDGNLMDRRFQGTDSKTNFRFS